MRRQWARGTPAPKRVKISADNIESMFMPYPKGVRIAALEGEPTAIRAKLK